MQKESYKLQHAFSTLRKLYNLGTGLGTKWLELQIMPPRKIVDMVYHNLPDLLQPAMVLQFQVICQC